jgi:hypothetical protein
MGVSFGGVSFMFAAVGVLARQGLKKSPGRAELQEPRSSN